MKITLDTEIKKKRHVFSSDAVVCAMYGNNYNLGLTFLELHGEDTANRAIWAHLVKGRKGDGYERIDLHIETMTGSEFIYVELGKKFTHRTIDNHLFIYLTDFLDKSRRMFTGGTFDEPSEVFMDAFRINLPNIPVLPQWEYHLWQNGLQIEGIRPHKIYSNSPFTAWTINPDADWEQMLEKEVSKWPV